MAELTRRYVVMTMASEVPFDPVDPDGVFVLKPWKDPAALRALMAYRDNCYPELRRDLDAWISAIQAGPVLRGDVGNRNERHVKGSDPARPTRARSAKRGQRPTRHRASGRKKRRR
jgi:hypothetical protein